MTHATHDADTATPEAAIAAVYASISGPAGAPRDWARYRRLMHPRALALRTVIDAGGAPRAEVFDVEAYIANVSPFFASNDFHEVEVARRIERYGQVAHAWSRYEARARPDSPEVIKRGANSIQLWHDGARWWIVSTVWDNDRDGVAFELF